MTLSVTYDPNGTLGRVVLTMSGVSTDVDYAKVETSLDGIKWDVIRGGDQVAITAGAGVAYHYEFAPGVLNMYRVSYVDTAMVPTFVAAGTPATGNNAPVVPANPAGLAVGDLKLIYASIRNSGTGVVGPAPAGWTEVARYGNLAVFGKIHQSADTAPTVTFTGGVVNADTIASMAAFRNAALSTNNSSVLLNPSAQNVAGPSVLFVAPGMYLMLAWKQDDFTSATLPTFSTKIAEVNSTAGDDASQAWYYFAIAPANVGTNFSGFPLVLTGGAAAISRGVSLTFPSNPYLTQDTGSVTPTFRYDEVWIKNPSRPGSNTRVTVTELSEIVRRSRTGRFDVLGRTLPVAVTDVAGSREFTMEILVEGNSAAQDMDNRLATGEPLFLQGPTPLDDVPTLYFVCGDVSRTRLAKGSTAVTFTIPVIEVARPGSAVSGDTFVWQDVVTQYATWGDVVANVTTWSNLIDKVSTTIIIVS